MSYSLAKTIPSPLWLTKQSWFWQAPQRLSSGSPCPYARVNTLAMDYGSLFFSGAQKAYRSDLFLQSCVDHPRIEFPTPYCVAGVGWSTMTCFQHAFKTLECGKSTARRTQQQLAGCQGKGMCPQEGPRGATFVLAV